MFKKVKSLFTGSNKPVEMETGQGNENTDGVIENNEPSTELQVDNKNVVNAEKNKESLNVVASVVPMQTQEVEVHDNNVVHYNEARSVVPMDFQLENNKNNDKIQQDNQDEIPQNKRIAESQVKNNAGGFVWKVTDMNRLKRFLLLGVEGGTYYTKEIVLAKENAQCISRLIKEGKGKDAVEVIRDFSVGGRAAKQNCIIFALAMCARNDIDLDTKRAAYAALNDICRIPTHLFTFIEFCEMLSRQIGFNNQTEAKEVGEKGTGWGRAHRRGIQNWYLQFADSPKKLAMHVTKYKNRKNWSHVDVLRLAHVKAPDEAVCAILRYIIKGLDKTKKDFGHPNAGDNILNTLAFLQAVEDAKKAKSEDEIAELIKSNGIVREHIPTNFLNSVVVWRELLQSMPMTAMIRNLGKMTSIGLINEGTEEANIVIGKLHDEQSLKYARIHPFNVLLALKTYQTGHGEKGSLKWSPNGQIAKALNEAFYLSFKNVQPTEKRYLLAVDVSGSMEWGNILGCGTITPRDGAAALSMVTARTEKNYEMVGFSNKLVDLPIDADMPLEEVINTMKRIPMGSTDCAQPMIWAKKKNKLFDVFIIYTDCETWAGSIHPAKALRNYRESSGISDAKLIVCAMTANDFTLADPDDPNMLDMAGFDSAGPEVMRSFVMGDL